MILYDFYTIEKKLHFNPKACQISYFWTFEGLRLGGVVSSSLVFSFDKNS